MPSPASPVRGGPRVVQDLGVLLAECLNDAGTDLQQPEAELDRRSLRIHRERAPPGPRSTQRGAVGGS